MSIFKKHAFGLDIGDSTLKLVNLNSRKEIVSYNLMHLQNGWIDKGVVKDKPNVIKAIRELVAGVKGRPIQTKNVVACLPEPKTFIKIFELPSAVKKTEINDLVLEQIPINFPLRWDEVYMDWKVINWKRREEENLKVLVGVSPRGVVAQYVDMLQNAGLAVSGLQVEATAIVNALHKDVSDRKAKKHGEYPAEMYIDLGYNRSSIIVTENGVIQFSLSLKNATKNLYTALAKKAGGDVQAVRKKIMACGMDKSKCPSEFMDLQKHYLLISKEIAKALKFYNQISGKKEFKLILTGGTALTSKLPEFFTEKLGIQTELGNPFTNIRFKKTESRQRPEQWNVFASAIGLAITGMSKS